MKNILLDVSQDISCENLLFDCSKNFSREFNQKDDNSLLHQCIHNKKESEVNVIPAERFDARRTIYWKRASFNVRGRECPSSPPIAINFISNRLTCPSTAACNYFPEYAPVVVRAFPRIFRMDAGKRIKRAFTRNR